MADRAEAGERLAGAFVDDAMFALRPDYRTLLLGVDGRHAGSPRLVRATGAEPFDTLAGGGSCPSIPNPARWSGATRLG